MNVRLELNQTGADCDANERAGAVDIQFLHQAMAVASGGLERDTEVRGHFLRRFTFRDAAQNLHFARRQLRQPGSQRSTAIDWPGPLSKGQEARCLALEFITQPRIVDTQQVAPFAQGIDIRLARVHNPIIIFQLVLWCGLKYSGILRCPQTHRRTNLMPVYTSTGKL
jgi:hypothetical protein